MANCNKPGKRLDSRADERHRSRVPDPLRPGRGRAARGGALGGVGPASIPDPEGTPDENYSIAIPPPNVTGALHMGHALNNTMQDALIRLNRMRGRNTKWILGTDHAGIATQTQVEKALRAEGTSREEIGREAFVERTWEWTRLYGGTIVEQLKRLGASLDYEDERFTLDEAYADGGAEGLRRPLRQGPDLPRQLPGQLGPGLALGDLRPRGGGARGHRHPLLRRLPARVGPAAR